LRGGFVSRFVVGMQALVYLAAAVRAKAAKAAKAVYGGPSVFGRGLCNVYI